MEEYQTYCLPNGLRVVHLRQASPVSYCGVIVNIGSRDEQAKEYGMAHFIEHMLFKGTNKRRSAQIINRLEDVGGELNAYTTKEETVIYATFLHEHTERAIELIADLVQHSTFPQAELEKEIAVIQDEIQAYNDSPAELIFDDFEEMLFDSNPMAHSVLGLKENLGTFTSEAAREFYHTYYQPENMILFSVGRSDMDKISKWSEKHFHFRQNGRKPRERETPPLAATTQRKVKRDTFQTHCLMGARAFEINHPDKMALYLLNNILGGPGMNSLLNLSLRERNGLVYSVESSVQSFTDCGWWGVYFGTDPENAAKCEKLVRRELIKLAENKLPDSKLKKYKTQLFGQLIIYSENKESVALALGKNYLRHGKYNSQEKVKAAIDLITAEKLQQVAQTIFDVDNLTVLRYA